MILKELLTRLEVLQIIGDTNIEVTGIQSDSRRVTSGNVFVAQVGTTVDGHAFIPQCIEKGATAIVIDKAEHMPTQSNGVTYILVKSSDEALGKMAHLWYGEPSKKLQLVGVTGTNGKTTTATLLYRLFKTMGEKVGKGNGQFLVCQTANGIAVKIVGCREWPSLSLGAGCRHMCV